jgi:serine O-acetyltransferase
MQVEARREAEREPLLVSFLHSTILNHYSLESALAFHLANRLSSPAMISTQVMSLIREALDESPVFRRSLRADIMAVRDRDPACTCLPDVFLYFKGFHALQTHRVANYHWNKDRRVLAHYLQSQVSQNFQIDIHPNATMGSGIMLDHGTGIVIGETATVGHNCSILHHVTLGGSGKKGVDRHPKVGSGVLLGAGASVLGNVRIGDGCQVGAGTLVISDLPDHSVAVGVPAKIIGSFVDVSAQPSIGMNQILNQEDASIVTFETGGI